MGRLMAKGDSSIVVNSEGIKRLMEAAMQASIMILSESRIGKVTALGIIVLERFSARTQ